jgi:choline dehydrogenase-like flavoprotein
MAGDLSEAQRTVLRALCDTFVPSLQVPNDLTGFWARSASAQGVDLALARILTETVAPDQQSKLLGLLDGLAAQNFASASQDVREKTLSQLSATSRDLEAGVTFYEKQTMLLSYGLPKSSPSNETAVTYGSPEGQNPNWETLGYPGPVSVPPKEPEEHIRPFIPTADTLTLNADVCVVGSGAGGAVIAARMAMAGRRVVILESGGHYTSADFHQLELWGYEHLWYRGGATPTSNGDVLLMAGSTLGGGTEINWMNCVRTPDLVREDWAKNYGLDGVDGREFDRYIDTVSKRIMASSQTAYYNSQNLRMREGCQKLGYLSEQTQINWNPRLFQPLMAGYTGFGDQTGGKMTARRTYVADAYSNGAMIICHCHANHVLVEQGRTTGVTATYSENGRTSNIQVRASQVVVACGSLESPALLLRSGIGGPAVGKYLRVQPGGAVYGVYKEKQKGWWGSPMTTNCEQFTDTGGGFGFYMEIPAFGPGFVASVIPWSSGRQHKEVMTKVPHISTFIWFLRDRGSGEITIDALGNSVSFYELSDEIDQTNFRHATAEAIRIHEAAGAEEILISMAHKQFAWARGQDLEQYIRFVMKQPLLNGAQPMISAHQLSTCRMGKDPTISVANTDGELYDVKGVWIGDASACPTALGANPMLTIMALAERTADRMIASSTDSTMPGMTEGMMHGLNTVPAIATNMLREMVTLMSNPSEMVREMTGVATNPLNMINLARRMFLGRGATSQICPSCGSPVDPTSIFCTSCHHSRN